MTNEKEFLFWENSSRDTIDFKMVYVDIANGDLVSGLLLSQIIYWFLPSKSGLSKIVETNGEKELIKKRLDWWREIRITEKQYDRAITILEKLGLVSVRLKKSNYYDGAPVPHIKLNFDVLIELLNNQREKSILTKGEDQSSPKGEIDLPQKAKSDIPQTAKSIDTETTPETTTKIIAEIKREEEKKEFPPQEKVSKFFEHHFETIKKSNSRETEMFNVDKLGILLDWSIEEYDKVLYTKQNSSWEPRRKQPNIARWLIATLQNEALMQPNPNSKIVNGKKVSKFDLIIHEEMRAAGKL